MSDHVLLHVRFAKHFIAFCKKFNESIIQEHARMSTNVRLFLPTTIKIT